ncbi:transmembrane protein, putative [Bodo saltans]|uniref:Transmembrane protein, putative n=1 Tax=Bodo saltans TaxID=75058 RepID=A0A0S4J4X1_BODSA|nr:transmembrane protein, putative [Bodo saltans]|eukprot:CUG53401.1 transmembrane protein, putative [Bodo saltans]
MKKTVAALGRTGQDTTDDTTHGVRHSPPSSSSALFSDGTTDITRHVPSSSSRSVSFASSALFWYQHWSTTSLYSLSMVTMLLLGILSRQSLYGLTVVFQVVFPLMRLVTRTQRNDRSASVSQQTANEPRALRSGEEEAEHKATSSTAATISSHHNHQEQQHDLLSSMRQQKKKLIYLPSRSSASRALMVIALAHLTLSALGGILVASVPFVRTHYLSYSPYFHLFGLWDPSVHWATFAVQSVLLGVLCVLQYMVTKRTNRILKAEAKDEEEFLEHQRRHQPHHRANTRPMNAVAAAHSTITIKVTEADGVRGGGIASPMIISSGSVDAASVARAVVDVTHADLLAHYHHHHQQDDTHSSAPNHNNHNNHGASRLTPGRSALLTLTTLATAMLSPSFVSFVFLFLHMFLLATMLMSRRRVHKWMCLYWVSLATLFSACVWLIAVIAVLSPVFGLIANLPSGAHLHDQTTTPHNNVSASSSPDAWLFVLGPSALPAFPTEVIALSNGNTTSSTTTASDDDVWDPETAVSFWLVASSIAALGAAIIARANLGAWSVPFRLEDARIEARSTWKSRRTLQRAKAVAIVQRFTLAAAAAHRNGGGGDNSQTTSGPVGVSSSSSFFTDTDREQLVMWICQYFPLILIPAMWVIGCSITNILSFGLICVTFSGLTLEVSHFMSVVPMLYFICAVAALMTYVVLLVRKTNEVRHSSYGIDYFPSVTLSPFSHDSEIGSSTGHNSADTSSRSINADDASGSSGDLLKTFSNALFFQDNNDSFTYTMVLLGIQLLALSALILARVVNKRAPVSTTYFHAHEKRHHLRTALATTSLGGAELTALKEMFLRIAGTSTSSSSASPRATATATTTRKSAINNNINVGSNSSAAVRNNNSRDQRTAAEYAPFIRSKDQFRTMLQKMLSLHSRSSDGDHGGEMPGEEYRPYGQRFLGFLTEDDITASWRCFVNGANVLLRRKDDDHVNDARLKLYTGYVTGTTRVTAPSILGKLSSQPSPPSTCDAPRLSLSSAAGASVHNLAEMRISMLTEGAGFMGLFQLSRVSAQHLVDEEEEEDCVSEHTGTGAVSSATGSTVVPALPVRGSYEEEEEDDNFEFKLLEHQIFGTFVKPSRINMSAAVAGGRGMREGGRYDTASDYYAEETEDVFHHEGRDNSNNNNGVEMGKPTTTSEGGGSSFLHHEQSFSPSTMTPPQGRSRETFVSASSRVSAATYRRDDDGVEMSEPRSHYHTYKDDTNTTRVSTALSASAGDDRSGLVSSHEDISKLFHAFSFFDFIVLEYFLRQFAEMYGLTKRNVDPNHHESSSPPPASPSPSSRMQHNAVVRWGGLVLELFTRHASTFALMGMFFAAVAENDLDLEQLVYVVLFVLLLSFPERLRVLWVAVALYAALHISAIYLFTLSYQHDPQGEAKLRDSVIALRIIGISSTSPWELTVYLVVMVCASVEYRFTKASHHQLQKSFPSIIYAAQWRALLRSRCVAWLMYHLFQGLGGVTFLVVVILQRRSLLGAGYILVYMLSSAFGGISAASTSSRVASFKKRGGAEQDEQQGERSNKEENEWIDNEASGASSSSSPSHLILRWAQAGYSIMALLVCSAFHLYGVNGWASDVMNSFSPDECSRALDDTGLERVLDCLAQLGLADYRQVSLFWSLGLWYVATVVHLAQVRSARSWDKAQAVFAVKQSQKLKRMHRPNASSPPQVQEGGTTTPRQPANNNNNNTHAVPDDESAQQLLLLQRCAVSRRNFTWEFANLESKLFHPRVLTALRLMRWLCLALLGLRSFARRHAYKALWVSLCVTGLYHPSLTHLAFLVLFLLDLRGFWVIGLVSVTLVQLYVYPLFFIPALPLDIDLAQFLGFQKSALFALTVGQVNRDINLKDGVVACLLSSVVDREAGGATAQHERTSTRMRRQQRQERRNHLEEHERPLLYTSSSPRSTSASVGIVTDRSVDAYMAFRHGSSSLSIPADNDTAAAPHGSSQLSPSRGGLQKRGLWFHLVTFATYMAGDFWIDASYEIVVVALLCAIGLGIERVSSACALLLLKLMLLIGRPVLVERQMLIGFLMTLVGIAVVSLTLLRIGLPESLVDASPFQRKDWYLGCATPILDIASLLVVFVSLRMMARQADRASSRKIVKENHVTFGSFLKSRSRALSVAMATKSQSIADIFGDIPHSVTRIPRNIQEGFLMMCTFLPPTALLAFFVGAMSPSILGVLDIVLGLLLLAFKQRVVWRFYAFWPRVLQYLSIRLLLEVIVHLPNVRNGLTDADDIAKNVGVIPWADASTSAPCVFFLLSVFFAIVQNRIFNEFFFAGEIIAMHSKLLLAAEKHVLMMHRITVEATYQELVAQSQEEDIRSKLEELRRERASLIALANMGNGGEEERMDATDDQEEGKEVEAARNASEDFTPRRGDSSLNTSRLSTGSHHHTLALRRASMRMKNPQFLRAQQQQEKQTQLSSKPPVAEQTDDHNDPEVDSLQQADSVVLLEVASPSPLAPLTEVRSTPTEGKHDDLALQNAEENLTDGQQPPMLLVRQVDSVIVEDQQQLGVELSRAHRKSVFSFLLDDDDGASSDTTAAMNSGAVVEVSQRPSAATAGGHPPIVTPLLLPTAKRSGAATTVESKKPDIAGNGKSQKKSKLSKRSKTKNRLAELFRDAKAEFAERAQIWVQDLTKMTYSERPPSANKSLAFQLISVALRVLVRNSQYLCFMLFAVNFAFSAALPDLLICLSAMCYAMTINPWADALYWDGLLLFNCVAIVVKAIMDTLIDETTTPLSTKRWISALIVNTGVWDPVGTSQQAHASVLDLALSFVVFAAVLVHRQWCIDRGVFGSSPLYAFHDSKSIVDDPSLIANSSPLSTTSSQSPALITVCTSTSAGAGVEGHQEQDNPTSSSPTVTKKKGTAATYDGVRIFATDVFKNWTTRRGAGKDYYAALATSQVFFIALFVLMYFPLSGQLRGSIVEGITQDIVPGAAVVIVFALVLIMCIERVVYITSSIRAKIVLHFVVVLLYTISYMVWNGVVTVYGSGRISGAFLFLAGMLTCGISALQIREGFPLHRRHDPFTSSTSLPSYIGYTVYRVIPFCFELRLLLDWAFTKTALPLNDWLLLEDVHSEVYLRFVALKDSDSPKHHRGMKYSRSQKVLKGFFGFVAILTILFFPLMYYSTYNPSLSTNIVTEIKTTIDFHGVTDIFQSPVRPISLPSNYADYLQLTRPRLAQFQLFKERSVQLLQNYRCSATTWSVPPTAKAHLREVVDTAINTSSRQLSSTSEPLMLSVTIELTRSGSSAGTSKTQTTSFDYKLDVNQSLVYLRDALRGSYAVGTTATTGGGGIDNTATYNFSVPLPSFYSPFLVNKPSEVQSLEDYVGEASDSAIVSSNVVDCNLTLTNAYDNDTASRSEFWCVECNTLFTSSNIPDLSDPVHSPEDVCLNGDVPSSCATTYNFEQHHPNRTMQAMGFVVASDSVASSNQFLSNFGIIALYTTFILALGSVLRGAVTGSSHRVVMSEMYDPSPVAELLQFIYMARSAAARSSSSTSARPPSAGDESNDDDDDEGDANLALEEELYAELLDLLRSPERVLLLTGLHATAATQHPPPK